MAAHLLCEGVDRGSQGRELIGERGHWSVGMLVVLDDAAQYGAAIDRRAAQSGGSCDRDDSDRPAFVGSTASRSRLLPVRGSWLRGRYQVSRRSAAHCAGSVGCGAHRGLKRNSSSRCFGKPFHRR